MKIVAKLTTGFIVEMSKEEMAKLLGAGSTYCEEYSKHKIEEGSKLNISDLWGTLQQSKTIASFTEDMIAKYRDQIARLEKIRFPKFLKDTP